MTDPQDQLRLAAIFAENVRRALRHLPTETVADLTDGIEADIASSLSDGASLPSIDEYTADLLRGAGIDPPKISELDEKPHYFTRIFSCIKNLTLRVFEFLSPLAPAWWLFRAWVVTQVLGWMICDTDSIRPFVNQWGENALVGIIVFVCVVVLSVKLGRQKRFVAATTTVNQPTGGTQAVGGTTNKALGNEVDLDLTYAYTEDVKFGVSAGYFAPGRAFDSTNKDSATQLLTSVNVAF